MEPAPDLGQYEHSDPPDDYIAAAIDDFLAEVGSALIADLLEDAESGHARDSAGRRYTPQAVQDLRASLARVDVRLGLVSLRGIDRRQVDGLLDDLRRQGVPADRLDEIVIALRALRSYAADHEPTAGSPLRGTTSYEPPESAYVERPYAERPYAHPRNTEPSYSRGTYGDQQYARGPYEEPADKPSPTVELLATARRVAGWTMRSVIFIFAVLVVFLILEL